MGYPCTTRLCACADDISECLSCSDGSNFISDEEPIQCMGCGTYSSGNGLCHVCGYDMTNSCSTSIHDNLIDSK